MSEKALRQEPAKALRGLTSKKCVLAYSGGLDTTTIVLWLKERGYEVHAVLVDVGQEEDLPGLCEKASKLGAASSQICDARPAMCHQVLPWVIGLGATYEGTYHLGTALARPFIAAAQVQLAKKLGGATLVHGATGKGNDQIRFEFAYRSLAPDCEVLAPWKVWDLGGRSDMIAYLRARGIEEDFALTKEFSMDENLWHLSVEGGDLEDPAARLDVTRVLKAVSGRFSGGEGPESGPPEATIHFEKGVPIAYNGERMPLAELVSTLNHEYRSAPWAWDLVIENRFTGVKSRGLYINPAAKLLHVAVDGLARTCLNKPSYDKYVEIGREYGALLYRGEFFSQQRVMLHAAASMAMEHLTGDVTVRLEPVPHAATIDAAAAIFSKSVATFEKSEFSHQDAAGFIRLAWMTSIGKGFTEDVDGGVVETADQSAPELRAVESMPGERLVPASV
ncbi:MAG TPA: argininosuccinate synthase [Phycisphaerae bacterium]|nr:argininosuccinate synthase [Phycisphaerae bacterium]